MKKKAFIFDLDGTLFETTAQEIESATGHMRYIEFNDSAMLLEESKPLSLLWLASQPRNGPFTYSHDKGLTNSLQLGIIYA